jgi:hypothetical protein
MREIQGYGGSLAFSVSRRTHRHRQRRLPGLVGVADECGRVVGVGVALWEPHVDGEVDRKESEHEQDSQQAER